MVVLFARDEDRPGETEAAVCAGALVRVERVAGAGPAVADEIGLGVHWGGGREEGSVSRWFAANEAGPRRRGAQRQTLRKVGYIGFPRVITLVPVWL